MRFDDRLTTVLGLAAEAPRDRVVQWRQLVELVARGAGASDPELLARALARITELHGEIPDAVRSSAARAIASPTVPTALIAIFAADRSEVAAPLLASAELDQAGWDEIRQAASLEVRQLVDTLSPPLLTTPVPVSAEPKPPAAIPHPDPAEPGLFRWECDASGAIDWVEGVPRAALVGRSLALELQRPFDLQLAFADERLAPATGAMAGNWLWSGSPRFLARSGRFAGYSGVARLDRAQPARSAQGEDGARRDRGGLPAPLDREALRELLHELRTPLTAIIGFGEIIEGQFLGPAHLAYRNRASEIVRQARRLLGATEDLDLAAKLNSGRLAPGPGARVDALLFSLTAAIAPSLAERGLVFTALSRADEEFCELEGGLAERLLRRFVDAVIEASEAGEQPQLVVDMIGNQLAFAIDRPRSTFGVAEEALLDPAFDVGQGSALGLGFSLRLVRGLASVAGGRLDVAPDRLILLLPARRA